MKKIKILFTCIAIILFIILSNYNKKVSLQNKILSNNQSVLLDSIKHYKINDSINTAQIKQLVLTTDEYKQYRADDANLINKLKSDKPENIIKTVTETHTVISTKIDTVYVDSIKHFSYKDNWINVNGQINNDSVKLNIKNKEDLLIVESIQRKKFLFIKLPIKIFGYKHKQIDVISKNPHTTITNTEFITIK